MSAARVLVVEDDGIIGKHLQAILSKLGFEAAGLFDTGEAAVEAAARLQPDVVLMDIGLAGHMNGIEAARLIQSASDIPVVFLTAYADRAILDQALGTDAFGYLVKPFEARSLQITLEMAIDKHRQKRWLAGLSQLTRAGLEVPDLATALHVLAGHLAELLAADGSAIAVWDDATKSVSQRAASGCLAVGSAGDGLTPDALAEVTAALAGSGSVPDDPLAAGIPLSDCGIAMALPLLAGGRKLGAALVAYRPARPPTRDEQALGEQAASLIALAVAKFLLLDEVQRLAMTDALTGVYNWRGLFEVGGREVERALRFRRPLTALMLDLDRFKSINDRCGHEAGNAVLAEVAARCQANTRTIDVVARYGGDEFAILLPESDLALAEQVAERVRAAVAAAPVATGAGPVDITISLGVAECSRATPDLGRLLQRADEALYAAKEAGRNRVAVAAEVATPATEIGSSDPRDQQP